MSTFDLFLTAADDQPSSTDSLQEALSQSPFLRPSPGDPTRYLYYNPDTTVHFTVLLSPDLVATNQASKDDSDDWEEDRPVNVMDHEGLDEYGEDEEVDEDEPLSNMASL